MWVFLKIVGLQRTMKPPPLGGFVQRPGIGDVLRPAKRVGARFYVSKNRDKAKCCEAERIRVVRRSLELLINMVKTTHKAFLFYYHAVQLAVQYDVEYVGYY